MTWIECITTNIQSDVPGVLVLSEFGSAISSIGSGAILVNPFDMEETADAIYHALGVRCLSRFCFFLFLFAPQTMLSLLLV